MANIEMTRKRIATIVGLCFTLLGFILVLAATVTISSQWDDENCCANKSCTPGGYCQLACLGEEIQGDNDSWFEPDSSKPDCCYGVDGDSYSGSAIFMGMGGSAFAIVIITAIIIEFGDKVCCEACQKCTACIVATFNILALILIILTIVIGFQSTDSGDSDGNGCEDYNVTGLFGQTGTYLAGLIFMALGVIAAILVTFIECCCDDSDKENTGGPTVSP